MNINNNKEKIMNKLTKIGVSALCGSLAAVSAANAGALTVAGGIDMSWISMDDEQTGNPIGIGSNYTLSGAGELDNGWAVGIDIAMTNAGALSNTNVSVTVPSFGALRISHGVSGSGIDRMDDVTPNVWEEAYASGLSTGINTVAGVSGGANIEYTPRTSSNYIGPGAAGHPAGGVPGIFAGEVLDITDITTGLSSGRLKGLIDIRDSELPGLQAQLDELAEKLKAEINAVHNKGTGFPPDFGLTGDRYVASGTSFDATGLIRVGIVNDNGVLQEQKLIDLSTLATVGDLVTSLSAMTNLTAAIDSTDRLALTASNGHRVAINELTSSVSGAGDLNKGISDFFGLNRFIDSNENFSTYRSDSYTSSTVDVVTTAGTLHFSGNDGSAWSTTVAYTAADTLTTLAAKINADSTLSTETIAASVVTDGALFRLELVDDNGDEFAISETGSGTVLSDTNLRVDARGLSGKMEIRTDIRENTSLISRGTLQSNTFESKSLNSNTTAFSGTTPTAAAGTLTFTLDASTTVAIAYTTSSTLDTVVAAINSNSTLQAAKISAEVLIDGSSFKLKIVDANSDDFMVVDSGGLTVDVSQGVNSGDSSVAEDLAASFNTAISFNEVPARGSVGGLGAATTTLTDYSARILSVSSARGLTIVNSLEFQDNLRSELATRNAAVSGVNMDEEMANMIIFEQAYLAAARLISMAQELYRTLTEIV